jgi:hypothetical protein
LLGWKPITPLKEELIKTIAYFEDLLGEPGIMESLGESPQKIPGYRSLAGQYLPAHGKLSNARPPTASH